MVCDLLPGHTISSADACVDDQVTVVLVVFVAATQDNGVGPLAGGAGDSVLKWPVHAQPRGLRGPGDVLPAGVVRLGRDVL